MKPATRRSAFRGRQSLPRIVLGLRHDEEVRQAIGVGLKIAGKVSSVRAALERLLAGQERFAERLAAVGIHGGDADRARALMAALPAAHQEQEALKARLKGDTERKNAVLRAAIAGVDRIVAAARLALAARPERRRLYLDLARWRKVSRNGVAASDEAAAGHGSASPPPSP